MRPSDDGKDIFDRWYVDLAKGEARSIKLFDEIAKLMLFNRRTACGIDGHCSSQLQKQDKEIRFLTCVMSADI